MSRLIRYIVPVLICAACILSLSGCKKSSRTRQQIAIDALLQQDDFDGQGESVVLKGGEKVLVVCFSATGNTRAVARLISDRIGADLFFIEPAQPYTEKDLESSNSKSRVNREQADFSCRPQMANAIENFSSYDVFLIGFPLWWGKEPRIIDSFVEAYDFKDKVVGNFCTSGSSGITYADRNIQFLLPESRFLKSRRFEAGASQEVIEEWLRENSLIE